MPRSRVQPTADDIFDPLATQQVLDEKHREERKKAYRKMGISQRREAAKNLFVRGYNNADVARELGIHPDTATRYRRLYEEELKVQAQANPHLLRDVLGNTVRALRELEEVRAAAWRDYESAVSSQAKKGFLDTALKAAAERNKLFGLMGVKQEAMAWMNQVKTDQGRLMEFMQRELCAADRDKLIEFMTETWAEELHLAEGITDLVDR